MKTRIFLGLLLLGSLVGAKAQSEHVVNSSPIVLNSVPLLGEGYEEIDLLLPEKGTYHFTLKQGVQCPTGYVIAIVDVANGNEFYLPQDSPHYFTVSRPVNKHLKMCLRKISDLPRLSASLVID